ncbi:hypothetical protein [Marinimicrobium agarilyticum]|uniref:hypothetical protein n=1 Tax=Marinimicrobium agarilyticum TaxID=306546 RepID=UPI000404E262|nr:hypothetical protein [Marinimicrobium agarilyticum]
MSPSDIRPAHIARCHDLVGQSTPYQANLELALITHVLRYAVRWGYTRPEDPEVPRARYIAGQRRVDLLSLKHSQLSAEGIGIQQSKTGKRLLIEWSPDLKEAINRALNTQNKVGIDSVYVISDNRG